MRRKDLLREEIMSCWGVPFGTLRKGVSIFFFFFSELVRRLGGGFKLSDLPGREKMKLFTFQSLGKLEGGGVSEHQKGGLCVGEEERVCEGSVPPFLYFLFLIFFLIGEIKNKTRPHF